MNTPEQRAAYREVALAKQEGRWHPGTQCVRCGSTRYLHEHHEDYTKPLDTVCLCSTCHVRLHVEGKAEAKIAFANPDHVDLDSYRAYLLDQKAHERRIMEAQPWLPTKKEDL
jgi:recombinational DNA repair protein (RecF pathway)